MAASSRSDLRKEMDKMIKIILVDDHPLMRLGIKSSLLTFKDEIEVIAEASSADELLRIIPNKKVDVVLLDIQMPGMSCEDAVRIMKRDYPEVKILILSSMCDNEVIYKLMKLGIDGFIPKTTNIDKIKTAVCEVFSGSKYYGIDILRIINEIENIKPSSISMITALTERELEVMHLCCEGLLSKEIAQRLNISSRTVEMHKSNIFKKLDINSTIELVRWSIEHGIVNI